MTDLIKILFNLSSMKLTQRYHIASNYNKHRQLFLLFVYISDYDEVKHKRQS